MTVALAWKRIKQCGLFRDFEAEGKPEAHIIPPAVARQAVAMRAAQQARDVIPAAAPQDA